MEEIKKDYSKVDYRFSYVLSVSDLENDLGELIICKRDFDINNFDETSVRSLELKETIDDIVRLIDRDLKSKSRVYTWCNMPISIERKKDCGSNFGVYYGKTIESQDMSDEFKTSLPESQLSTFKFTFFDRNKAIISKIWSGDSYPATIRNSVDLTNKKYKYENVNIQMLDFPKSVNQRAAADRPDLTYIITKHLSSACSSYFSNEHNKRVIYKQYLPELALEEIIFTDACNGKFEYVENKTNPICRSFDERGNEKVVYEAYTSEINVGKGKTYKTRTPVEDWEDDLVVASLTKRNFKR